MSFRIYVVEHAPSYHLDDPNIVPLHVGAARSKTRIEGALRDDTGDNISIKNDTYCELTGIYWVWKNAPKTDFVGFFHYRRHLDFRPRVQKHVNEWGVIEYPFIDESYVDDCGLTTNNIERVLSLYDLVLPALWDVSPAGSGSMFDHYARGPFQNIEDLKTAIAILLKRDPAFRPYVERVNGGKVGRFTNMFLMRWNLFDAYCSWMFDILSQLEEVIDISDYTVQQRRVFGFVAEWLTSYYFERYLDENPDLTIIELNRTFVKDTRPIEIVAPAFGENPDSCVIATAFDDAYAPYAASLIASICRMASRSRSYEIHVLSFGLRDENRRKIQSVASGVENIVVNFVDVSANFRKSKLSSHAHFTKEMYCRLKIPAIFKRFRKVIYIDPDTVVLRDLSELISIDLEGGLVGATRDLVMAGFRTRGTISNEATGKIKADAYLRKYLGLKRPEGYFQSGVLVFDINALNASAYDEDIDRAIDAKRYWFPDQDILNVVLEGRVAYIDGRWNALFGNGDTDTFFADIAAKDRAEFFSVLRGPYIVHFAGERKPWKFPGIKFGEKFWHFARMTPFYEELLSDVLRTGAAVESVTHAHPSPTPPASGMHAASGSSWRSLRDSIRLIGYMIWPLGRRRRTKRRFVLGAFRSMPRKESWPRTQ